MKKITSIFSLALFSALTLSLSSCNDCEGGESSTGVPADVQTQLSNLTQQLAEQAQKVAALPTDGSYVLSYDPATGYWKYTDPTTGAVVQIDPNKSAYKIDPVTGNWLINGQDTGIKAVGQDGQDGQDGKSGLLDAQGVYVTYTDANGDEQKQYFPQFTTDADNNVTKITVGGTTYNIPAACKCSITITKNADGSYTISDGKGNDFTSYTCPDWVNDVTVTHNGTNFEIATTADPTKKVTIPNGYAELSIDATTGVATVKGSDGTTEIKLQETQPVVYTDGKGHVAIQNYDLKTGKTVGDAYLLPTAGQFADLTAKVDSIDTALKEYQSQIGTWDPAAHNGKTLAEAVDSIGNEVSSLETKISSMFNTLMEKIAESITNIQVEEVLSNAIGSFNGVFTNLKTTKLVGYVGSFQDIATFPSDGAPEAVQIPAGTVYSDTLGTIQLTVNPIGTNFSNVAVSLVNSQGNKSCIKLSNLEVSKDTLKTGITRAGGTNQYLYKTKATISSANDLKNQSLHVTIDKGAIKEAAKTVWNDLKAAYNSRSLSAVKGETFNKVANAIYNVVNGISTERLAIMTEWEQIAPDPVSGKNVTTTKSIVSPYDLSGVVVQPLGFETLPKDTLIDKFKKLDNKAKNAISKLNTRIAKKIISTINENANLEKIEDQINDLQIKIKKVKPIPEDMKIIKQVVDIDTTVTVKVPVDYTTNVKIDTVLALNVPVEVEFDAVVPKDFSFDETTHKVTVKEWGDLDKTVNVVTNINFVYSRDINFKNTFESDVRFWIKKEFSFDMSDMVDNVNNALDVVTSVNGLCESVNGIINNIYKMEDRLLAGNYLNRVYKFLDKASEYSAKGIYKLFQPVLLVNSEKGFGFAGIRGAHAEVSGKVEVIPTTYSNGLVAPVYKKYISVNGKPIKGSNGKSVHSDAILDITSALDPGMNRIDYYAIDYYGTEKHLVYYINNNKK